MLRPCARAISRHGDAALHRWGEGLPQLRRALASSVSGDAPLERGDASSAKRRARREGLLSGYISRLLEASGTVRFPRRSEVYVKAAALWTTGSPLAPNLGRGLPCLFGRPPRRVCNTLPAPITLCVIYSSLLGT